MIALGIAALAFPFVSTLVAALFVGWTLLLSGVVTLVSGFSIRGSGPFFGALLLGLLSVAAGVFLIFNPLAGAVILTILLGVIFMLQGAFEFFFSFELHPHPGWIGMLISAGASVAMALVIAAGWPTVSSVALGIILGVNFLSSGIGYMIVSRRFRPAA